jgi:hypothetical protein
MITRDHWTCHRKPTWSIHQRHATEHRESAVAIEHETAQLWEETRSHPCVNSNTYQRNLTKSAQSSPHEQLNCIFDLLTFINLQF